MARGDFTIFEEFADYMGQGDDKIDTDTLKLGIIDNTLAPTAADATPQWSDYSANEVVATGNYTSGGETLTFGGVTRWSEAAGVGTLDADDVVISQHASGFTDGYYGILYFSATGNAIGFVDLGGPVSEQDGDVTIAWNASGILTITIS